MAASGALSTTASIMPVHNNNNAEEKESGSVSNSKQLSESLSQFGNVKNEFIVSGRSASKNLIQERRFDEAVRVCEMVLAVDPGDIETVDLKERAIVYLNNPDQFDLHKMQKGSEATPQRLLRSASERRTRKSDGGALIRSTAGAKQADKNNNPETSGENDVLQPVKLRRTRSEMHRTNVMDRIKEFERHAKNKANGTIVTRPPDTGEESETLVNILEIREQFESSTVPVPVRDILPKTVQSNGIQKSPVNEPIASSPSQLPSELQTPRRIPRRTVNYLPNSSPSKSVRIENPSSPSRLTPTSGLAGFSAFKQIKTEVLSPVSEDEPDRRIIQNHVGLLSHNGKPIVKWTEIGMAVNPNLRSQLDTNFFKSNIIKKACIVSLNADVWACFGWNYVKKVEFQVLLEGMASQSYLTSSKLRLDGIEFSCLSGTNTVVRGRVNKLGVNCTKLNNVLVIVMYEHPVLPKETAMLVRRFEQIMIKNET